MVRPDEEEIEKTRKETQAALDKIVGVKIQAAQPTSLAPQPNAPTYIKYTPAQQGSQYNSGAAQRIIKMQDMPVDPMEPPKFRAKKVSLPARAPLEPLALMLFLKASRDMFSTFNLNPGIYVINP